MACEKQKNNLFLKKIPARIAQITPSKIGRPEFFCIAALNFLARSTTGSGTMPDTDRQPRFFPKAG
jgi:hypothetical protein